MNDPLRNRYEAGVDNAIQALRWAQQFPNQYVEDEVNIKMALYHLAQVEDRRPA